MCAKRKILPASNFKVARGCAKVHALATKNSGRMCSPTHENPQVAALTAALLLESDSGWWMSGNTGKIQTKVVTVAAPAFTLFTRAINSARKAVCVGNLRGIGNALQICITERNGILSGPPNPSGFLLRTTSPRAWRFRKPRAHLKSTCCGMPSSTAPSSVTSAFELDLSRSKISNKIAKRQ